MQRIALGRDKELERAIRILLALELRLGLSLRELYCGDAEAEATPPHEPAAAPALAGGLQDFEFEEEH